jgi:HK97 family phage prohead protease
MGKNMIDLNQHLNFKFGTNAIDTEKHRVSFILSDETIVNRDLFDLKLLHGENNINLDRKSILKVFYNHNSQVLPIGRWDNLRIEDKKLKADAIFDTDDEFAMKIFNKLKKGFLESISVGVSLLKWDIKQRGKHQKDLVIVKKWEIFEASVVSIPAIPTAKIGLEFKQNNKEKKDMTLEELKEKYPQLFTQIQEIGADRERARIKAIDAILKPDFAHYFTEQKFDGKSTAEQIELAQYRKMDELGEVGKEKLKKAKKDIDDDAINLGKQVLDIGLSNAEKQSNAETRKKDIEYKEDMEAFFSLIGGIKQNA